MAERRMFSKTIIDSDAFLDMPLSSQALYFHLSMRADDEGFINCPKRIQRLVGASDDDFKLLAIKNFIIPFESGIVVIKHWKIHNYIRKDRITETVYQDEKSMLETKANSGYTLCLSACVPECLPACLPSGGQVTDECQHRIGKDRLGKDSIDKTTPIVSQVYTDTVSETHTGVSGVIDFYESNIGTIASSIVSDVQYYIEQGIESQLIITCLNIAVDNNKRNWSYARGVLKNLINKGIQTQKQYEIYQKEIDSNGIFTSTTPATGIITSDSKVINV